MYAVLKSGDGKSGSKPKSVCFRMSDDRANEFIDRDGSVADGCIDLYFKCVRFLPDSKKEQEMLRGYVKEALERCDSHGGFPGRTAFGYRLFLTLPGIYRRILKY